MAEPPAYQRIAADLSARILSGELEPGTRLPSLSQLRKEYGVSRITGEKAYEVLIAAGTVEGRFGSGYYVRHPAPVRDARRWYVRRTRSPFAAEARAQGQNPGWDWTWRIAPASAAIAERLGLEPGAEVIESSYVFKTDGRPTYRSRSWEPRDLTRGTPIELPEEGPHAGWGVLDRMDVIGVHCDRVTERVYVRRATAEDEAVLEVGVGDPMLAMERTYLAGDRAVETADIAYPEGWRAIYELPVREAD